MAWLVLLRTAMPSRRLALRLPLPILVLLVATSGGCREEGDITIGRLRFEGVDKVDKGALTGALQTRAGSRLPWGRKRFFDRSAFEADLRRIEVFYRDRGFPDARVRSFDVDLNDAQDKVDVTVHIDEGEPITVAGIDLKGFDVLPEARQKALRATLPLQPTFPLDRQLAAASRERALNALRDEGYPYADVSIADVDADAGPRTRRILLEASPGMLAQFGPIDIRGQVSVSEQIIRRQLNFEPGERFTRTKMRQSQRKVYGLELFEFVNIESREDPVTMPAEVPVRVTVAEGKHQRVTTGIGYGTEEQARARIRWDHANFLGNARHLGVEAKWSSLDRGVRFDLREPYFVATNLSLNFDGQAWQAKEPWYGSNQLGGRMSLRYQTPDQTYLSASLLSEYQRSTITAEALENFDIRDDLIALGLDPRDGVDEGTLSAVAFDVGRNTTDNLLDSRTGWALNGHFEQAGSFLWGTYDYRLVSAEARHYLPIGRQFVVANRLRGATIDPAEEDPANVPFRKRFFIGGASSIRGWGRLEVSPLSGFGLPIGGFSMIDGSTEARFPVWGKLGGVLFLDYGNVWAEAWDFDFRDLRYAVGPGLRYATPIGPVRFDVGWQVNPIEGLRVDEREPSELRRWRIHLSIGQAF
jgi:outer membrane protein assembly complex protein YaeT